MKKLNRIFLGIFLLSSFAAAMPSLANALTTATCQQSVSGSNTGPVVGGGCTFKNWVEVGPVQIMSPQGNWACGVGNMNQTLGYVIGTLCLPLTK